MPWSEMRSVGFFNNEFANNADKSLLACWRFSGGGVLSGVCSFGSATSSSGMDDNVVLDMLQSSFN